MFADVRKRMIDVSFDSDSDGPRRRAELKKPVVSCLQTGAEMRHFKVEWRNWSVARTHFCCTKNDERTDKRTVPRRALDDR